MIKHILFDVDDTLFPSSEFAQLARKNAIHAMIEQGINYDARKLYYKLLKIIKEKGSNYPGHFTLLCRELKIKRPSRYIAAAIVAYHNTKTAISTYPEVKRVLLDLKKKGYFLYIATNGKTIKQWDKLIRLGISHYFDDVFVSEEIGKEKSVAFFKKVLKKIKADKEQCVMVGDREEYDIIPAKNSGIKTIRVLRGNGRKTVADFKVSNLSEIVEIIKHL